MRASNEGADGCGYSLTVVQRSYNESTSIRIVRHTEINGQLRSPIAAELSLTVSQV